MVIDIEKYYRAIEKTDLIKVIGKVVQVVGLIIEAQVQGVSVGDLCVIRVEKEDRESYAEVVGFREKRVLLMPLGSTYGISPGSQVLAAGRPLMVQVGKHVLGRVLSGLGEPIDGKGQIVGEKDRSLFAEPPDPVKRPRVTEILKVGVRAIDGLLTIGRGQRMGIFAGSGVGKSTLMGMIARNAEAEVNVIALVGERGREVRDFIEESLGEEGLKKSVVVVATSDQPPLIRLKAAFVATAIAEYFRDLGNKVILMMDSVTRFAMAQREVGLAAGEPPTTRGYTPSVFALLPKLMERSGTSVVGSITAFYTILVEGDDFNEPIADQCRSILDGHIMLSRDLAARNHYPAIDVSHSVSRLMTNLVKDDHKGAAAKLREVLARYNEAEDLINIGAYVKGSNPKIDYALSKIDEVNKFLQQGTFEQIDFNETAKRLVKIFK
ncbi:EscN/YscN/HrcN family type III secretion system ATPase [candidate division WOR-1 bacterium RIFOXYD2_FULL_36_8]|uniref:Type 3 secretion system ATPase n=1 Tax=candidate division WOR-1 bacterium RIFOXYB2_FULL_36_35 TaxID=1802578 RepID=A0A1F4S789_UNCSA|nr:MAG: EscN/YscN/HrcN family type III secretion system ATPase [candidate division WOR-1 bacterium RIFOXYA2_FULL_36_21]OGC15687.1 MAG: EscN/YscN/HrcN family type III secretion system ATPase [candidate division WOR-1 bacterium RIFOXYA12_FULL_36_13]OGC16315.1 MAG: EscN/YscN/HrcN family type III secretion system ATPase [candidate division WOR-1 bacterium RIFOXYB2_FULL_36_35]OGC41739.1 MAG: EscN/YscN/HrcN family type III secretion system ATPase [candidate division WOR-1 bacterium RIFOXYD2_FULL_36_8]